MPRRDGARGERQQQLPVKAWQASPSAGSAQQRPRYKHQEGPIFRNIGLTMKAPTLHFGVRYLWGSKPSYLLSNRFDSSSGRLEANS